LDNEATSLVSPHQDVRHFAVVDEGEEEYEVRNVMQIDDDEVYVDETFVERRRRRLRQLGVLPGEFASICL
jgi:hypothetical protein